MLTALRKSTFAIGLDSGLECSLTEFISENDRAYRHTVLGYRRNQVMNNYYCQRFAYLVHHCLPGIQIGIGKFIQVIL